MRHPLFFASPALCVVLLATGCGQLAPDRAAHVVTGYTSHQLCSSIFLGGRDGDGAFHEIVEPMSPTLSRLISYHVDPDSRSVSARLAGTAASQSVYQAPFGCTRLPEGAGADAFRAARGAAPTSVAVSYDPIESLAPASVVQSANPALVEALDHAFLEPDAPPHRWTKAIVVVHHDRIIAERYAPGVGIDTPLTGWSSTKSVTSALIGILVREHRVTVDGPAPVAEWADARDPRRVISIDNLLRMESGLDAGSSLNTGATSAFDRAAQMTFVEDDTASFAAGSALREPPGTVWNYTDANYQILSRIVRDEAGGNAQATDAFVRRELFDRLGMRHATLEFDAAGTPLGASHLWAPAREWARFGLLYLHDGVIGGERILPAGWVEYSARETPGSGYAGYGAGFWTNRGEGSGPAYRIAGGMPADTFMTRGTNGQFVLIIPSHDLVIVRLGNAWTTRGEIDAINRLVREVIAGLDAKG